MNDNRIQLAHRTALTELCTSIVNLKVFNTHEKKAIAFASLYVRLFSNQNGENYIASLTKDYAKDNEAQHHSLIVRLNALIHVFKDEDGDFVFNQSTGGLSEKWASDMVWRARAIEAVTPEAFLPTTDRITLNVPSHGNGVKLINTAKKFAYQQQHDMPNAYAALNVLQYQKFRLSSDIVGLRNLPTALDISKNYAARHIALTNMEAFKDTFHFRYTMDYRGRIYCRSIIANLQGDSFAKAAFEFAESKELGQYGLAALKIHYANASGHDKLSFDDRIAWANGDGLIKAQAMVAAANDWTKISPLIEDYKHAFEEYTAARELIRAIEYAQQGNDIKTYRSALVTHQDATNSGFQFGAALTGDRETAEDVNITATQTRSTKPADLYGKMATNLKPLVVEMRELLPTIDRKFCKKPIMVTGYGAGIAAVMRDIQGDYPEITDEANEELEPHVKEALHLTASSMVELTKVMHSHAKEIVESDCETIEWVTPDGFRVVQQKRDNSDRRITLSNKQQTLVELEKGQVDPIDEAGMTKALPPNFIHSMDAQMLRTAAMSCGFLQIAFAPIHDSFGTHAGSFFDLNRVLKESFVDTMEWDWYSQFCVENNVQPQAIKSGDYRAVECLKATYMFS